MERIGQTAVLGELLAGVLIGPGGLGLVHDSDALHALAELGVLILLFEVGLESDLNQLPDFRRGRPVGGSDRSGPVLGTRCRGDSHDVRGSPMAEGSLPR